MTPGSELLEGQGVEYDKAGLTVHLGAEDPSLHWRVGEAPSRIIPGGNPDAVCSPS